MKSNRRMILSILWVMLGAALLGANLTGLLTLFMGGFIILDTVGISFVSELVAFNTYGRQLCMMLAVYCMGLCVCGTLTGKPRKIAKVAMLLSALLNSVLIVLSFTGVTVIYDTGIYWTASQVILCPLLLVCAAVEWHHHTRDPQADHA